MKSHDDGASLTEEEAEFLRLILSKKPVGGKAVWILGDETVEIDHNYDPPIVRRIKK